MAKQKEVTKKESVNISRPGVHAKCKSSNHKHSKLYRKKYKGQGR